MAKKIKVKVIVTLDSADTFLCERDVNFDGHAYGADLAEAVIEVASGVVSDVVKSVVEDAGAAA